MNFKLPFLKQFNAKTSAEHGRSMVEILGVLAVIGVLSAGGIYGYSFAMDKYRANDIVYEVNLRANDIWHKYQEMPLPEPSEDGTDFDEFPDTTGTGYPIYMTSHPDVAFKTYVEGVSSRVCKNVVNMNLNGVIQGIQFVQVAQGDGDLVKYTGSASICGEEETDNLLVFTSFVDSESNEGEGQSGDPCVEEEDCQTLCAPVTCEDDMTCHNSCTGTSTPFCYDNDSGGVCVECLSNKDCPNEQICDLTKHECVALPESCGEGERYGKEYRAANGSCVSCDYMSEIVILNSDDNDGIFEKQIGSVSIKDTRSGIDMCNACQAVKHRTEETGMGEEKKTYCATSCVKGSSFLNISGGCVSCSAASDPQIPDDDKARFLCDACSNRISAGGDYRGWYCARRTCPDGEYKIRDVRCVKCDKSNAGDWTHKTDFYGGYFWAAGYISSPEMIEEWSRLCEACATSSDEKLRTKKHVLSFDGAYYCVRKCEDNQFQTPAGDCYNCTTPSSISLTGTGGSGSRLTYLKGLCTSEKCGRIYKDGYCILPADKTCEQTKTETTGNQFLGTDLQCHLCTESNRISVDTASDCEDACPTTREYHDGYCYKKCGTNEFNIGSTGVCTSCSSIGNGVFMGYTSWRQITAFEKTSCQTKCGMNKYDLFSKGADSSKCAPIDCGTGKLRKNDNQCQSCLTSGSVNAYPYQSECEKCPNHIYLNGYCVYVSAGQSGVCNNDSPDTSKYPNFSPVGLKYRDNTGICRSCSETDKGYEATAEECASCGGIRTLIGGKCMYGGCLQNDTFMSTSGCPSCDATGAVTIPDKTEAEQLCHDCNRRIMMKVDELKYCVQTCDDGEWQDINGDCWGSEIDVGSNEIGIDELSAQLCRNASRTPTKDNETGKVYCQKG